MKLLPTLLMLVTTVTMIYATGSEVPISMYFIVRDTLYHLTHDSHWNKAMGVYPFEAAAHCAKLDMTLPDMATAEKETELIYALRSHGFDYNQAFWTSGVRGVDCRWTWTNLETKITNYTNWVNGLEPSIDPGNGYDFIFIAYGSISSAWGLHKVDSWGAKFVICQQKLNTCRQ